jgi:hypothetical protein
MTRGTRNLLATLAVAITALVAVPVANADPVSDCAADGSLNGSYSNDELRGALGNIPADLDEYSDCRAQIAGAIGSGGSGPKAGASSNAAATPAAVAKKKAAAAKAKKAKKAKKHKLREIAAASPDSGAKDITLQAADTSNGMPTGLILALIALGLLALAAGLMTITRRVPAVGNALRRVPLPGRRR